MRPGFSFGWSWVALFGLAALGQIASTASASVDVFPPLNAPSTQARIPGKFIWADLFTTDPESATKFYCNLFGWTAVTLEKDGKAYVVLSNEGRPVAGVAQRPRSKAKHFSCWIGFVSVTDVEATLAAVKSAGGQVRASARPFPDRGSQAIIADSEDSTIGVLQSSSGDGTDDEPNPGEWNWFELYAKQPERVAGFYRQVFNFVVAPDTRTERKGDFMLSSAGQPRAGVAPLPEREDAHPGWLGVVRVANLDAKLTRAAALGGEVLVGPRPVAYESRFAIIADPTGGSIGLVEYSDNANPATRP